MAGERASGTGEETDEALAERVRARGDVEAFARLVARYRSRVLALARRMLVGDLIEDAEDVAQEAFVAAYDRRATFRRGEPFRPWLYRIAINRCLDRLRAQGRRPALTDWESAPEPEDVREVGPLEILLADEREARLQQAVEELPPAHRAVFLLRHLDDLSYEEIALSTGLPMGTVKAYLFRARQTLRQSLTGYLER